MKSKEISSLPGESEARSDWREVYVGGSPEAEEAHFRDLAAKIARIQQENRIHADSTTSLRTFYAKIVVGVINAELSFRDDLPSDLHAGHFVAGAKFSTIVRLSNASGMARSDMMPDLRGAALKISLPDNTYHDLLMASYPISHARDATQFVEIARIGAGPFNRIRSQMIEIFGLLETERIINNLRQANRPSKSLALESYWSRGAILWGDAGPVKLRLSPVLDNCTALESMKDSDDALRFDFATRLNNAAVLFALHVQKYKNEQSTPIEDAAVEWKEEDAPWLHVATLNIPTQDILALKGKIVRDYIDSLAFNPWTAPATFRPLGNLNRARRTVYKASAAEWRTSYVRGSKV
ncbi:hypothetical protein [Streptomyces sp. NPDC094468]|uniref:hypothetical protein n=1 Tax=Streptomyces sp. NPDC094468 TaxID=3366066 RepID=UPI00382937DA